MKCQPKYPSYLITISDCNEVGSNYTLQTAVIWSFFSLNCIYSSSFCSWRNYKILIDFFFWNARVNLAISRVSMDFKAVADFSCIVRSFDFLICLQSSMLSNLTKSAKIQCFHNLNDTVRPLKQAHASHYIRICWVCVCVALS